MATYVNDLRLTELATGEGSGTWGVTTNTNLELIGEALGYGTQDCFASDADATTTVADGATDPARAMYFKVTSSATLTATRTLTIAPNTMTRVMLIENATTGSQSIAISQGSGGNVTIASGQVKMVYLDGAGAGAAVVDAMASLELGTITVANLTATTADINGGTIDGATIATSDITVGSGKTLDVSAGTFTVANDQISGDAINGGTATPTTLTSTTVNATTVDTTNIEVTNLKAKDGTAAGSIADSTGVVTLASSVLTTTDINGGSVDGVTLGTNSAVTEAQIDNININGNTISSTNTDGNVTITPDGTGSVAISKIDVAGGEIDGTAIGANSASTAVFTDLTASGTVSFSGATVSDGGTVTTVDINGGSIDGTIIGAASPAAGTFTNLTATGTTTLAGASTTADITFGDNDKAIFGAGSDLQIYHDAINSYIDDAGTGSLLIRGTNLQLRSYTANENFLTGTENGAVSIYYDGVVKAATTSTGINVTGTVTADGADLDGAVVINESGADVNFRVESNNFTHMFFVDAGLDQVLIGSSGTYTAPDEYGLFNFNAAAAGRAAFVHGSGDGGIVVSGSAGSSAASVIFGNDWQANGSTFTEEWRLYMNGSDDSLNFNYAANTATAMQLTSGGTMIYNYAAIFNESGGDNDFRVESDTNTHMLFVDAGNSRVGINNSSPATALDVAGTVTADGLLVSFAAGYGSALFYGSNTTRSDLIAGVDVKADSYRKAGFRILDQADNEDFFIGRPYASTNAFVITNDNNTRLSISSIGTVTIPGTFIANGAAVINQDGGDSDFRVESDTNTHGLFLDASTTAVGINHTSAPGTYAQLAVRFSGSDANVNTTGVAIQDSGTNSNISFCTFFNSTGGGIGSITRVGTTNVVAYNTTSDRRAKENIADADDAGAVIDAIQVRKFDWIEGGLHQPFGLIAQELIEHTPEAVHQPVNEEEMMGVDYSKLVPMLIKEIQSLRARVAQLEGA